MKTYLALVHKDPDSAWGVSFPDLPGCHSAADDFGDLLANAAEALALWFEDADPVEPRDLAAIREAVAADLRDGAFLLAVPYVRRTTTQRRVNISLDTGTLDAIDQAAKDMRLTRSAFIALATANEIRGAH
ncbi:type II toxin-antitoxin system HicB family antitoxin [Amaricoccus sp.]|nr:type II toxin-antitoxin system HicB family antitoxin [uncultured Amaricoccus sp.]